MGVFSLDHAGYLDEQYIQFWMLSLVSFYSKEPIRCRFSLLPNRAIFHNSFFAPHLPLEFSYMYISVIINI